MKLETIKTAIDKIFNTFFKDKWGNFNIVNDIIDLTKFAIMTILLRYVTTVPINFGNNEIKTIALLLIFFFWLGSFRLLLNSSVFILMSGLLIVPNIYNVDSAFLLFCVFSLIITISKLIIPLMLYIKKKRKFEIYNEKV